MQPQILFRVVEANLTTLAIPIVLPLMPLDADGALRIPDGVEIFSLDQLIKKLGGQGGAGDVLRDAYERFIADCLTPDDAGRLADPRTYARATEQLKGELADAALHRLKFPHLSDQQFHDLQLECEVRGLNPWNRHVWAKVQYDETFRKMMVRVLTTVDGLRAVAQGTGKYAGQVGPEWCDGNGEWTPVWLPADPPAAARVGVRRSDWHDPLWRPAKFDECALRYPDEFGEPVLAPFWQQRPSHMIAKVAEAFALRAAFPEVLAGLYTVEEMGHPPTPGTQHSALSTSPSPELAAATGAAARQSPRPEKSVHLNHTTGIDEDEAPSTEYRFTLALIDLGFGNFAKRRAFLEHCRDEYADLHDIRAFRQLVLRAVKANPERFREWMNEEES